MIHAYRIMLALGVGALSPTLALAADEGGGEPSLFAGTWLQSLAAIVAFAIVLLILRKYAWGPILQGLQDRENQIKNQIGEAEKANAQAKQTLSEYERKLAEAHAESRKLLDQTRADAEQLRARHKAEAEAELNQLRQRANQDIDRAKQQALSDLYAHSAELATAVATKILQRQLTPDDTQRLVDESLREIEQMKAG